MSLAPLQKHPQRKCIPSLVNVAWVYYAYVRERESSLGKLREGRLTFQGVLYVFIFLKYSILLVWIS